MTVSSLTTKNSHSGDGSTSAFPYTFKIFNEDDVTVIIRTDSTGTESPKNISSGHYTVSGVGNTNGGNVTFTSGNTPASGETVLLLRNTPLTQATDYTPNDPFPAATHEDALDKLTLISQDTQEEIGRSIKLSRANTMTSTEFTVPAATRANKVLGFDSSGELAVTQELGTFKGDFAASTSYVARDIIRDTSTGNIFIVNEAHTSSGSEPLTTNANSAKYTLLIESAFSGVTAGTVSANKGILVDGNKDITGFRNVTLTGELDAATLDISGNADIDGTLEADAMTLNGTAITATATLDTGISNNNVPKFTSGVADNDFLRVDGTAIEGRSASEVLSDISAAPAAGSSNIVTTGALDSGSITSGFGTIDTGSSNITTTGLGTFGSVNIDGGAVDGVTIGTNSAVTDLRVDNLKLDGNTISSTNSNGAVTIDPNGTGNVALGNFTFDADQSVGAGQDNFVLKYDNSAGTIQLEAETSSGLSDIVNDSSPQLGGNLDLNSNNITGTGNISTTGSATFTTADNTAQLTLISTDADGSTGPILVMYRNSSSPADNDLMGEILFNGEDSAGNEQEYARIQVTGRDVTDGTEDGQIDVKTLVAGSVRSRMVMNEVETVFNQDSQDIDFRVESDGNANMLVVDGGNDLVGIGTSPAVGLHVKAGSGQIRLHEGNAADNKYGQIEVSNGKLILHSDKGDVESNSDMQFHIDDTERMRITSDGKIGIGTTSISSTVEIHAPDTNSIIETHSFNSSDQNHLQFRNNSGTEVGFVLVTTTGTTYGQTSDHRLKENVADMTGSIDRVKALAPKRFNFIIDPDKTVDGFLAHEAQAVVPESVTGTHNAVDADNNPVYQGIDHSKLVPLLAGALQEAIAKIETLETKVAALEAAP